jgi:hypothetical protein
LIRKKTYLLRLDAKAPNIWGLAVCRETNDGERLYLSNRPNGSIDIYHLEQGVLIKRIDVSREGRHSIRQIQGFTVISDDTMIVFDRMRLDNAIRYVDDHVEYLLDSPQDFRQREGAIVNHVSVSMANSEAWKSSILMAQWPLIDLNNWDLVMEFPWLLEWDVSNQRLITRQPPYPSQFNTGKYWGPEGFRFSRAITREGAAICSWGISDSLHILYPVSYTHLTLPTKA